MQVSVSAKDKVGAATQSHFEEFVVFRIAAFANRIYRRDELGYSAHQTQKLLPVFQANVAIELGTGKNVSEFVHDGFGYHQ
jgi:hypothetical protein